MPLEWQNAFVQFISCDAKYVCKPELKLTGQRQHNYNCIAAMSNVHIAIACTYELVSAYPTRSRSFAIRSLLPICEIVNVYKQCIGIGSTNHVLAQLVSFFLLLYQELSLSIASGH